MIDCDVVVVGAGIIGSAVARELATRGASVTLIDGRGIGLGSTQAAAGMLVPYLEGLGRPLLPLGVKSLAMYDRFVADLAQETGLGVTYSRTGSLQVVLGGEDAAELEQLASDARSAGVDCELVDGAAARRLEPQLSPDAMRALAVKVHGFVLAAELSRALVSSAVTHGARMLVPAHVRRIAGRGDHLDVHLEGDVIGARQVVVAAGSWSAQIRIDGVPALPIKPIRGQLVQLAADAEPPGRVVWGRRCYVVPVARDVILVGATVEDAGFDERSTVAGVHDLLEGACDLLPYLWQAAITGVRVGLRPATPDQMPIIGRSTVVPGLLYATGHYRNGMLLAPLTARVIADLVGGNTEDPLLAPAVPQRFGEY